MPFRCPARTRRIALTVKYDGTDYCGFQIQARARTVQGELQSALSELLQHQIQVTSASRTDAGVHALGQVVAFDTTNPIPPCNILRAINEHLPAGIAVVKCNEVVSAFHPRYDAIGKNYRYRMVSATLPDPMRDRFAWRLPDNRFDIRAMREAAQLVCGKHDFAAFASAGGAPKNTVREIFNISFSHMAPVVECSVYGNGFLYMMVRNLIGAFVKVGRGECTPGTISEILESRDRSKVGPPAPPQGLFLVKVEYRASQWF